MIETSVFPYPSFPIRLEYEDKSGKIVAFFSCEEHLEKHLEKYKLNKKKSTILRRPEDWIDFAPLSSPEPVKTQKTVKTTTKRKPRKKKI